MSDPWQAKLPWAFAISVGLVAIILYGYFGQLAAMIAFMVIGGIGILVFFVTRRPNVLKQVALWLLKVGAIFGLIVIAAFFILVLTGQILI